MSSRFEKLFSLPENLYCQGAPVIIAQGFLLKDNEKGNLLAQLKLKNISDKVVSGAKVQLVPVNEEGDALADKMTYAYAHLTAARDEYFGQKSAVIVAAAEAVGFEAAVAEVTFADESVWKADTQALWSPLPVQNDLLSLLQGDAELVKQYQMEYTPDAKFQPVIDRDVWCCACGAINRQEEPACHSCGCSLDDLSKVDFRVLNAKKLARLEGKEPAEEFTGLIPDDYDDDEADGKKGKKKAKKQKKEKLTKEEKKAAKKQAKEEKKAAKKKKKKAGKIIVVLLLLAALGVGGYFGYGYYVTEQAYQAALTDMNDGKYTEAIEAFQSLGNYKDSADLIMNVKYLQAVSMVNQARYEEAIEQFQSLGNYKDCVNQIQKARYLYAVMLAENAHYREAINLFNQLGDYEDAQTQIATLYKQGVNCIKDDRYDAAIEIFSALGDYQKSPGLLLCTMVGQKMATSLSSVTQDDLDTLPKDYPYAKKLLAYYNNFKSLKAYVGTFTCEEQTGDAENSANKKGHTLISDFQLSGGKILWVFSDDAANPTKNRSADLQPVANYSFFNTDRTVVKNRVIDRYRVNDKTVATATVTFENGKIVYQNTMTLTAATKQTETLTFARAKAESETTTAASASSDSTAADTASYAAIATTVPTAVSEEVPVPTIEDGIVVDKADSSGPVD